MFKKIYELPCLDGHKSFYGKARVMECTNGEKLLQSYNTIVCKLDADGNFVRLWNGYSATTQRHVNSFLQLNGLDRGLFGLCLTNFISDAVIFAHNS